MGRDGETVPRRDLILQVFDVAVLEFDDHAALGADHVVVMALVDDVVVVGLRAEVPLLGDAGFA